jgi:hypothetical protein
MRGDQRPDQRRGFAVPLDTRLDAAQVVAVLDDLTDTDGGQVAGTESEAHPQPNQRSAPKVGGPEEPDELVLRGKDTLAGRDPVGLVAAFSVPGERLRAMIRAAARSMTAPMICMRWRTWEDE